MAEGAGWTDSFGIRADDPCQDPMCARIDGVCVSMHCPDCWQSVCSTCIEQQRKEREGD